MTAIALEGEVEPQDLIDREHKKNEYKAYLSAQIEEKQQAKQAQKQRETEDDIKNMHEFANYYRIGARNQGGGAPIRD